MVVLVVRIKMFVMVVMMVIMAILVAGTLNWLTATPLLAAFTNVIGDILLWVCRQKGAQCHYHCFSCLWVFLKNA